MLTESISFADTTMDMFAPSGPAIQHDWDSLAITETWLKQTGDEQSWLNVCLPATHSTMWHVPVVVVAELRSCRSVSEHVHY